MSDNNNTNIPRRHVVKQILIGSVLTTVFLPSRWKRPNIASLALAATLSAPVTTTSST